MPNSPAPRIGKSLLGGVTTLRENASAIAGIWALCCVLPGVLIFIACSAFNVNSDTFAAALKARDLRYFAALGLIGFVWLGFRIFAFAAVINVTAKSARSQPVMMKTIAVETASRFLALTGAMVLSMLVFGVGLLLLVLPGYYLQIRLSFVECVVCADGRPPFEAFRRSWKITEGYFWPTAGLIVSVALIMFGALRMSRPFNAFLATTIGSHGTLGGMAAGLMMNTVQLLIAAWGTASLSRFFVDLSNDTPAS